MEVNSGMLMHDAQRVVAAVRRESGSNCTEPVTSRACASSAQAPGSSPPPQCAPGLPARRPVRQAPALTSNLAIGSAEVGPAIGSIDACCIAFRADDVCERGLRILAVGSRRPRNRSGARSASYAYTRNLDGAMSPDFRRRSTASMVF
jgi:hypothetical protein